MMRRTQPHQCFSKHVGVYSPRLQEEGAQTAYKLVTMLWVDCDQYYGPDRRRARERRMRDRRRIECGERVPAMNTALLQLRMRTLDAQGNGIPRFIERIRGVVTLAKHKGEAGVAEELIALNVLLASQRNPDPRQAIYDALDRALAKSNQT
jgi:hypothetical protein